MYVIFPEQLAVCPIVTSFRPKQLTATFIVKACLQLHQGAVATWMEEPALFSGDVNFEDDPSQSIFYSSDFAPYKPKADLLLVGSGYSPNGVLVPALKVRVKVGQFTKSLTIIGNREWSVNLVGGVSISKSEPFTSMPLQYEQAFGGPGISRNPVGRGYRSSQAPNIEEPGRSPSGPRDTAAHPAGFGPLDFGWTPRKDLVGTYDNTWLTERWPWLPQDFDLHFFNAAPLDQQVPGFLAGDEEIELDNLHPDYSSYRSWLPGLKARCFVSEWADQKHHRPFREVPLVLDTLWINMEEEQLILVWRGLTPVRTLKLKELEHVLAVTEPLDSPRPIEEYRALLEQQLNEGKGEEISPDPPVLNEGFDERMAAMEEQFNQMDARFGDAEKEMKAMQAEADQMMATQKEELVASGVDPDLLKQPSPQDTSDIGAMLGPVMAELTKMKAQDPSLVDAEQLAHLEKTSSTIKEMEKETKKFKEDMSELEKEFEDFGKVKWTREGVIAAATRGEAFVEQDLVELDLSGLDLSGMNFEGSRLSNTNLKQTNLKGANLHQVNLTGADLSGANLTNAVLDEADLSQAMLTDATLLGLSLHGTTLAGLKLEGADFSTSKGEHTDFSNCDLVKANFSNCQLPQADFSYSKLDGGKFIGSQLQGAWFCEVSAPGSNFDNADMTGFRGNEGANFTDGSFKSVHGKGAIFEASTLDRADFSRSNLIGTQFSETSLCNAVFDRVQVASAAFDDAIMQHVTFTNSDVLRATFDRVDLTDANLEGSNFFETGFWDTKTAGARFSSANLKSTLLG